MKNPWDTSRQSAMQSRSKKEASKMPDLDLSDIFSAPPQDEAIQAGLAAYKEAMEELLTAEQLSEYFLAWQIDPRKIYCIRTGQPLGTRDEKLLSTMMQVAKETGIDLADLFDMATGPAPHWISTQPEALRYLEIADPAGFFAYSCTIACEYRYLVETGQGRNWRNREARLRFRRSQILCHELASKLPTDLLLMANEMWRNFLSNISPRKIDLKFVLPHEFLARDESGIMAIVRRINELVADIVAKEQIRTKERHDIAYKIQRRYGGLSNFRFTTKIKGESDSELALRTLKQLGFDIGTEENVPEEAKQPTSKRTQYSAPLQTGSKAKSALSSLLRRKS